MMIGMSLGQVPGGTVAVGPGLGITHTATYFLYLMYAYKKVNLEGFEHFSIFP